MEEDVCCFAMDGNIRGSAFCNGIRWCSNILVLFVLREFLIGRRPYRLSIMVSHSSAQGTKSSSERASIPSTYRRLSKIGIGNGQLQESQYHTRLRLVGRKQKKVVPSDS